MVVLSNLVNIDSATYADIGFDRYLAVRCLRVVSDSPLICPFIMSPALLPILRVPVS